MGLAGGSMLALPFASTGGEILAVSCVFNGVAVAGWNSLDIVSAEVRACLLPTLCDASDPLRLATFLPPFLPPVLGTLSSGTAYKAC